MINKRKKNNPDHNKKRNKTYFKLKLNLAK